MLRKEVIQYSQASALQMSTKPKTFAQRLKANRFAQAGLPLLFLVVGGSFFLSQFTATQVEFRDKQARSSSVRQFNLEEEHRKLMKNLDIDNFTLSRIPRPEEQDPNKAPSPKKDQQQQA